MIRAETDYATAGPRERAALAELLRAYHSPEAFEVFAAILEEEDAPRAERVRSLAAALRAGELPPRRPRLGPLPVRERMLGLDWLAATEELEPGTRAALASWTRPVLEIHTEPWSDSELAPGSSKFGGAPDLPADLPWPTWRDGLLGFMGQFDLADLPGSLVADSLGLPEAGLLSLFALDDEDEGIQPGVVERVPGGEGYQEIPGLTRLVYTPPGTERVRRPVPPELVEAEQAVPSLRLRFTESFDVPWPGDVEAPELAGEEVEDVVHSLRGRVLGPSRLGGWPVHSRTSNTCPGPDWVSLVTLASDDDALWCWADGESLEVFVHRDSIADRSFGQVSGYAS